VDSDSSLVYAILVLFCFSCVFVFNYIFFLSFFSLAFFWPFCVFSVFKSFFCLFASDNSSLRQGNTVVDPDSSSVYAILFLDHPTWKLFILLGSCLQALFSSKIFCKIDTVALSFVFDKYYPIMD
jgi:hypothetical protein